MIASGYVRYTQSERGVAGSPIMIHLYNLVNVFVALNDGFTQELNLRLN